MEPLVKPAGDKNERIRACAAFTFVRPPAFLAPAQFVDHVT
jgi:hypothetical protein